jgi:hypothetical protein
VDNSSTQHYYQAYTILLLPQWYLPAIHPEAEEGTSTFRHLRDYHISPLEVHDVVVQTKRVNLVLVAAAVVQTFRVDL